MSFGLPPHSREAIYSWFGLARPESTCFPSRDQAGFDRETSLKEKSRLRTNNICGLHCFQSISLRKDRVWERLAVSAPHRLGMGPCQHYKYTFEQQVAFNTVLWLNLYFEIQLKAGLELKRYSLLTYTHHRQSRAGYACQMYRKLQDTYFCTRQIGRCKLLSVSYKDGKKRGMGRRSRHEMKYHQ